MVSTIDSFIRHTRLAEGNLRSEFDYDIKMCFMFNLYEYFVVYLLY